MSTNSTVIIKEKGYKFNFKLISFGDPESVAFDLSNENLENLSGLSLHKTLRLLPENSGDFNDFTYEFNIDDKIVEIRNSSDIKIFSGKIEDFIHKFHY